LPETLIMPETVKTTTPVAQRSAGYVEWAPVIAGAIAAAALAFVLHSFAAAIGISVSSTAPTWRDASFALVLLAGLYLVLVALLCYGLGGYLAGRLCSPTARAADEEEFRDGGHGLIVWALATLLTALLALAAAQALTRLSAPSTGPAGTSESVAGENIIAFDLDRLFRGDRRADAGDITQARSEAARILFTAAGHRGIQADDRAHLVRLVSARTGLAGAEAERRVDDVIARAKQNITRARRSAVVLAFSAGAAALLGAAAAVFGAWLGGRHRLGLDGTTSDWRFWGPLRAART
jgi:hypothetical protein